MYIYIVPKVFYQRSYYKNTTHGKVNLDLIKENMSVSLDKTNWK